MPDTGAALREVRRRLSEACARAGRSERDVRLVAVSKTFPAERVRELVDLGHDLFGENRVQEAREKMAAVEGRVAWHLIGHLQRNKVRQAVGYFELIHGVDSIRLAAAIDRVAGEAGIRQALLLQVNVSGEPSKFGVDEAALPALGQEVAALPHVDLAGLMTIPAPARVPEDSRRYFAALRTLRDRLSPQVGLPLPELSMGMTGDFEVAVEEGATLVRVGRALFGERA